MDESKKQIWTIEQRRTMWDELELDLKGLYVEALTGRSMLDAHTLFVVLQVLEGRRYK